MKKKYKIYNPRHSGVYVITNESRANEESQKELYQNPCDFETAIEATGFGRYNILLALTLVPTGFATAWDTSTMSYIIPIAQCDLSLTLEDKGVLNAIIYSGMICSAFIWGFISDILGRKRLLVIGYLLDSVFVIIGGLSQHYTMLAISKFISGFIITGPTAVIMSYLNEYHSSKYRPYIPLLNGITYSIACIILPLLGWLVFSDKIVIALFNGFVVLRSWNIFLFLCSIPSLVAGLTFTALPESPKFLMSVGKNEEALTIFQKIYSHNTGTPPETYPIKQLLLETSTGTNCQNTQQDCTRKCRSSMQILKEGWKQFVPLLHPPYVRNIVIVFITQFGIMIGLNTLRLWLPQLFTAMNDYQAFNTEKTDQTLCKMVEMIHSPNNTNENCFVNYNNKSVYINNIIVFTIVMLNYLLAIATVKKAGKRNVLIVTTFSSGICGLCIYFAKSESVVIGLSSMYTGLAGVSLNVLLSIVIDIVPTAFRTMTISLTLMFGRIASLIGNLLFPILLTAGCMPPFLTIGCLTLGGAMLSTLLPKTDNKALE